MHRKACNRATIWSLWRARKRDFAKFPVKFPVSRENGRSRGPSALLRQPASPVSRYFLYNVAKKPAVSGLLALGGKSLCLKFDIFSAHRAENLRAYSAKWPFSGETSRRLGLIVMHDRLASGNPAVGLNPLPPPYLQVHRSTLGYAEPLRTTRGFCSFTSSAEWPSRQSNFPPASRMAIRGRQLRSFP